MAGGGWPKRRSPHTVVEQPHRNVPPICACKSQSGRISPPVPQTRIMRAGAPHWHAPRTARRFSQKVAKKQSVKCACIEKAHEKRRFAIQSVVPRTNLRPFRPLARRLAKIPQILQVPARISAQRPRMWPCVRPLAALYFAPSQRATWLVVRTTFTVPLFVPLSSPPVSYLRWTPFSAK